MRVTTGYERLLCKICNERSALDFAFLRVLWREEESYCLCELDDRPPTTILSNASRKTDRQNETLERRKTNRQTETFERKPVAIPSETDR